MMKEEKIVFKGKKYKIPLVEVKPKSEKLKASLKALKDLREKK